MSWFIPVLLAWPASDRIEVIPQPDPPVAASARVLAMAQQVEFRRVDARPDPDHAEDGGEQVVVAGPLGRASGRERRWQYVVVSVVDGTLKKKRSTNEFR